MVSIAIRFLAGRYHATGWDHHVNEGVPEWPPAPFRILRALVAASFRLEPRPNREELEGLLALLAPAPTYGLPASSQAHTRHFMPTQEKPTKIFDTFIAIGDGAGDRGGEIVVSWPQTRLTADQAALFARLLNALGYLGRAESWVECRLLDSDPPASDAHPLGADEESGYEARLLACEEPDLYSSWRRGFLAAQPKKSKVTPPESLLDVLLIETGQLHKEGWSSAPGTRWLRYGFQRDPFRRMQVPGEAVRQQRAPTLARYAISSRVLPGLTEAITIGERMRQALMSHSRDEQGISHPAFMGRDLTGAPRTGHQHAYFLPEDSDGDERIDHIVVWCRGGFDPRAEVALRSITRLWGRDDHELWLLLVAIGQADEYGATRSKHTPGASPMLGPARIWRSATPFVPPRHAKRRRGRWSDLPHQQLARELSYLRLPPCKVEALADCSGSGRSFGWHRFRRQRTRGGGARGPGHGFGFQIEFEQPLLGPIAVGYGAHFGLGRFEAVR